MEDGIRQAQGRSFKLFLKKSTKTKLHAIATGTFITCLFQSSSIINLTLLSFIGAGTLPLGNALGMALGANIGGTFNSWLLAWAGFGSAGLQILALPLIAFSGCALTLFRFHKSYQQVFKIVMGFGFLLFGLDYIKENTLPVFSHIDFSRVAANNRLLVLLAGLGITAITQTSSATVAIVMSALHSSIISLPIGISIVLGAELGTTIKIVIAAFNGSKAQKQLATTNVIFNVGSALIGFVFLMPIIQAIQLLGIESPVLIVASFQTLINLISALLFLPVLGNIANTLDRYFKDNNGKLTPFIQNAVSGARDDATELLEKETGLFLKRVLAFNTETLGERKPEAGGTDTTELWPKIFPGAVSYQEKYHLLKKAEGAILDFYSVLDSNNLSSQSVGRCGQFISAVQSAMYSAKGMKDIRTNLNEFSNSGKDDKFNLYLKLKKQLEDFYSQLHLLLNSTDRNTHYTKLKLLMETVKKNYNEQTQSVFQRVSQMQLNTLEIATVFNINREIFSSQQSLITAVKDFLLDAELAAKFENGDNGEVSKSSLITQKN